MTKVSFFRILGKFLAIFMRRLHRMWLFIASKQWPCFFLRVTQRVKKTWKSFFTDNKDLDMESFRAVGVIRNQPEFARKETSKYLDQRM